MIGRRAFRIFKNDLLMKCHSPVFTEGSRRTRQIAEILALSTHIKRHPGAEPPETPPTILNDTELELTRTNTIPYGTEASAAG